MVVMMTLLLCINPTNAVEDIIIGELDGTKKLTIDDIKNGFNQSNKNYIKSCDQFSSYADNFLLTVEMGAYKDYLIPQANATLCDLLTSTTSANKYVYAPKDPRSSDWDGFTIPIAPSLYDDALGGSAEGYATGGRSTLSFWGDNGENGNHTGGCCALQPEQKAAWFRPYRLLLTPMTSKMYLSWGVEPTLAVTNGPVMFEVNVWNMRSEPYNGSVDFKIVANGKSTTVSSPTGRYTHYGDPPAVGDTKYSITVELVNGPMTVNTKVLETEAEVVGKLPWDVKPCEKDNIPELVHFGEMGAAIGPVDGKIALEEDWFASTIVGGESQIRPVAGHFNTAQTAGLLPTKYRWENVTVSDGVFNAEVPCKSIQYYAFSVYSAVAQRIVVYYGFDSSALVYFGGKRFVPQLSDTEGRGSFTVQVTQGYHQVLVKMFSDGSGKEDPQTCTTNSQFWIRVVGTAVGYTHAVKSDIPEGAYELWGNAYMFYLLHLGEKKDEFLYGGLDEDFINVRYAVPKRGDQMLNKTWKVLVFSQGRIPVSGETIPEDKEAAVKYLAFAIYNGYDSTVPVGWTFITGGKTEFFVDGIVAYSRPSDGGSKNESFTTPLSSGWHEVIARVAATKGQSWPLTYYIHFDNYRLGGAMSPGSSLPFGLAPVRPGIPIPSLMELVDEETENGAIPFDPKNGTAIDEKFADIPISPSYMPGLLSKQRVWILGQERQFQWVSGTSTNGIWKNRAFGGNFNQYWAFALYATTEMVADIRIAFQGGYAIWMDAKVIGSAPLTPSSENVHTVTLKSGWHQVFIKLRAKDAFYLVDTDSGNTSWTNANAICAEKNHTQLCPHSAVCPLGVGRPGVIPVEGNSSFVPVSSNVNEWVQISKNGGDETSLCHSWRETHGGVGPEWGESDKEIQQRRFVPCCDSIPPLSMWLSITPTSSGKGELGYTYDYPIIIEAPVLTVQNPAAVTQLVTMTSATPGATIKYSIDNSAEMKVYTSPVTITKSTTVTAQAFANDRESQETHLFVDIPSVPSIDRATCLAGVSCPLTVKGVDPGWRVALLRQGAPGKGIKEYLNESYALKQQQSLDFSGVISVGANNDIVVPPLGNGSFDILTYGKSSTGEIVQDHLVSRITEVLPNEVMGTQQTVFQIKGGVMDVDAVLIPFETTGSPETCDAKTCFAQLTNKKDRIAILTSNSDASFTQDLYGYEGNLNCLCICLSCSPRKSGQREVVLVDSKVVSLPITLHVTKSGGPTTESVTAVQPSTVSNGTILELHGKFNINTQYSVVFTPVTSAAGKMIIPLCTIQKVMPAVLTCEMSVRAGVMGNWNVSLTDGQEPLPFEDDVVRTLRVHPPNPSVDSASGMCAVASASCVTGAQLTFHGINFNPVDTTYTKVTLADSAAANPIQCEVTSVSETQLSCTLDIPRDKEKGVHAIGVSVRVSETEWSAEQSAGFLVLGAGTGVAGWKANTIPTPTKPSDEVNDKSKTATIVGVVLGLVLMMMIVGVIVFSIRRQNRSRREEMFEEYNLDNHLQLPELNVGIVDVQKGKF
ncbi:uncharacterized protein TM35_000083670 [Trypanosoma theileri]|uniref:Uncharacterized protein n=1 Tax=Trypanosoma theileri TaxID=67003 RepID=A0A1X0P224_9TRYP|nr:uncharacterized protein TM35_000083670 [Trypanosoma theileri]ORC90569.1 hypothetical protein TM35_000083670 [Trypanosoma theileri]